MKILDIKPMYLNKKIVLLICSNQSLKRRYIKKYKDYFKKHNIFSPKIGGAAAREIERLLGDASTPFAGELEGYRPARAVKIDKHGQTQRYYELSTQSRYWMPLITEAFFLACFGNNDVQRWQNIIDLGNDFVTVLTHRVREPIADASNYYNNMVIHVANFIKERKNFQRLKLAYIKDRKPSFISAGHIRPREQEIIMESIIPIDSIESIGNNNVIFRDLVRINSSYVSISGDGGHFYYITPGTCTIYSNNFKVWDDILGGGPPARQISTGMTNKDVYIVNAEKDLWYTDDGARSWKQIDIGKPIKQISATNLNKRVFYLEEGHQGRIYYTDEIGRTLHIVVDNEQSLKHITRFSVNQDGTRVCIVNNRGLVYSKTLREKGWERRGSVGLYKEAVQALFCNDNDLYCISKNENKICKLNEKNEFIPVLNRRGKEIKDVINFSISNNGLNILYIQGRHHNLYKADFNTAQGRFLESLKTPPYLYVPNGFVAAAAAAPAGAAAAAAPPSKAEDRRALRLQKQIQTVIGVDVPKEEILTQIREHTGNPADLDSDILLTYSDAPAGAAAAAAAPAGAAAAAAAPAAPAAPAGAAAALTPAQLDLAREIRAVGITQPGVAESAAQRFSTVEAATEWIFSDDGPVRLRHN